MDAPHAFLQWITDLVGDNGEGKSFALALRAHESIGNHILVTDLEPILDQRYGVAPLYKAGIFDLREAVTTAEAFLRFRGSFPITLEGIRQNVDEVGFYSMLSGALLKSLRTAQGSCLSPRRRESNREVSDFIESILGRCRDILVAHDELGRLNHIEKYEDANNRTLLAQMYHFRHAMVLMIGCLNAMAWIIAVLGHASGDRRAVTWSSLNSRASWTERLDTVEARAMCETARTHPFKQLGTGIQKMRDAFQHRDALRAGVLEFREGSEPSDHSGRIVMGAVDLLASVSRAPSLPRKTAGLILPHGQPFILPYQFLRHSLLRMCGFLNDVMNTVDWPDSHNWYEDVPLMVEERKRVWGFADKALWLFGAED